MNQFLQVKKQQSMKIKNSKNLMLLALSKHLLQFQMLSLLIIMQPINH